MSFQIPTARPTRALEEERERQTYIPTGSTPSSSGATPKAAGGHSKKRKAETTAVFVEGLPTDASVEEIYTYFKKAGVLRRDIDTDRPLIKLYETDEGKPKGEALITYVRP